MSFFGKIFSKIFPSANAAEVVAAPENAGAVHIEIRESFGERIERMFGVILGAKEAFFFGGDGEEEDAAFGGGF